MPEADLSELVAGKSETLDVEYKRWMDTSSPEARAKLARHIAALANHGAGYLVFGVDDDTREPMGETTFDRANFSQRALAGIAERYLDPPPHLDVDDATHAGVAYPVVTVQSHGARPVVAKRDGPIVNGATVGVREGEIYVRAPGPKSLRATTADHWNPLLDRCLARRADLLATIMRQAIAKPGKPSRAIVARLTEFIDDASQDFAAQADAMPVLEADIARVALARTAHCALGYALVDGAGEAIELGSLRALVSRAAVGMRRIAQSWDEWTAFLPLTHPSRAPQVRATTSVAGEVVDQYLEGMRLPNAQIVCPVLDYWRVYEAGFAISVESYYEDYIADRERTGPYLTAVRTLFRLHSLLVHARFVAAETPGVEQILVRMDWRGLTGRPLLRALGKESLAHAMASDRFVRNATIPGAELRDRYLETLLGVALPFFDAFPNGGARPAEQWLTREFAEAELSRANATVRFDE